MKKHLFFLISILSLFFLNELTHAFFAGCTEMIRPTPEKQWQCEYLDKIIIHYGPGIACYKKNQEQGENDLRKIAMNISLPKDNVEEAWIYIHNKELWIDVGRNPIEKGLIVKVGDDYEVSQQKKETGAEFSFSGAGIGVAVGQIYHYFTEPGDEITFYHIHPDILSTFKMFCGKQDNILIASEQILGNFPSGADIKVDFDLKGDLNEKNVLVNPAVIIGKFYTVSYDADELPYKAKELDEIIKKSQEPFIGISMSHYRNTNYLEMLKIVTDNLKKSSINVEITDLHFPEVFYKRQFTPEEIKEIKEYLYCESSE